MQLAHARLADTPGLTFHRLMGSGGGNGFSLAPNWGVYAWLGQWEDRAAAEHFFATHDWYAEATGHSQQQITFYLQATMSHGAWGGGNPFTPRPQDYDKHEPVAVITRATIHPRKLPDFWRYVPRTSASVYERPERLLSIGIGEYPIFMQATFSLWTSGTAMTEFAYSSTHHREVVQLTRSRGWYREELFTRFRVADVVGAWSGFDLSALVHITAPDPASTPASVKVVKK